MEKSRKPPVTHKPSYVAQVIYECCGNTADAAAKLRVTRKTVLSFIRKYPACKEAREAGIDELLGVAEDNLCEMVYAKDKAATFFVLKTLGRKKWSEKESTQDVEDKEEPLEFELTESNNEEPTDKV